MFFIPKLRGGISVLGIAMALAVPWLIHNWPDLVFGKRADIVPVPVHMQVCRVNDDCGYVETACSSCCHFEPVNKSRTQSFYDDYYGPACQGYHGAVCDCVAGKMKPYCKKGVCLLDVMPVYND